MTLQKLSSCLSIFLLNHINSTNRRWDFPQLYVHRMLRAWIRATGLLQDVSHRFLIQNKEKQEKEIQLLKWAGKLYGSLWRGVTVSFHPLNMRLQASVYHEKHDFSFQKSRHIFECFCFKGAKLIWDVRSAIQMLLNVPPLQSLAWHDGTALYIKAVSKVKQLKPSSWSLFFSAPPFKPNKFMEPAHFFYLLLA